MTKYLQELLKLQEVDMKIMALCQEKESLPLEMEKFSEAVKVEEDKKKAMEEENQILVKERRQKERELEGKNETRKKFQEQLYQVKSNKEYSALLHEIEDVKKEIEKLEEEILVLMEKIEEREKSLSEEEEILKAKKRELEEATKRNQEKMARIESQLKEWEKDRVESASNVPEDMLIQYERIRQARNGIGLAPIKNNACQGCFMELPPQVISETKLGQRLVTCENCNRLLYIE